MGAVKWLDRFDLRKKYDEMYVTSGRQVCTVREFCRW